MSCEIEDLVETHPIDISPTALYQETGISYLVCNTSYLLLFACEGIFLFSWLFSFQEKTIRESKRCPADDAIGHRLYAAALCRPRL